MTIAQRRQVARRGAGRDLRNELMRLSGPHLGQRLSEVALGQRAPGATMWQHTLTAGGAVVSQLFRVLGPDKVATVTH